MKLHDVWDPPIFLAEAGTNGQEVSGVFGVIRYHRADNACSENWRGHPTRLYRRCLRAVLDGAAAFIEIACPRIRRAVGMSEDAVV